MKKQSVGLSPTQARDLAAHILGLNTRAAQLETALADLPPGSQRHTRAERELRALEREIRELNAELRPAERV